MISIIIPCLNEADYIEATLKNCLFQSGEFEVIVVDGGSSDNTKALVRNFSEVQLINTKKGRAHQLNKGAQHASGTILLFLHGDTLLPTYAIETIQAVFTKGKIIGGSFYLKFNKPHFLLSMYTQLSKINHSFFTYGDHGIFIKKQVFTKIGGFKNLSFMEDAEIQIRARKSGKFLKLPMAVETSVRRFEKYGYYKQFFKDMLFAILFKLGIAPDRMKKFYPDHF